jgi:hypothetical protein
MTPWSCPRMQFSATKDDHDTFVVSPLNKRGCPTAFHESVINVRDLEAS